MDSIEASGKSVDEATQQALMRLGKRREEVQITVLQEPSRGTFGIGSKEARILATVLPLPTASVAPTSTARPTSSTSGAVITPEMADAILGPDISEDEVFEEEEEEEFEDDEYLEEEEDDEDEDVEDVEDDEFEDDEEDAEYEDEEYEEDDEPAPFLASNAGPSVIASTMPTTTGQTDLIASLPLDAGELESAVAAQGEMQDIENPSREDVEITVDVLQHILRYMNIHATVNVRSTSPLRLNIQGINENLGLLIGRKGETLAALQLLVSLIVGHRTHHRMRIVVDAENYRERREDNLRSLALRVAQQVRNYHRSIALEAMPPHERRIVHIALADSKDISTESIGEGEERRVVISLKRPTR